MKQLVGELGGVEVWQTAMQPAKPFAFGRLGGTPFFGLPGNPVSVMVAFEQFTRPALPLMMGSEKLFRPRLEGVLVGGADTDPAKTVSCGCAPGGCWSPIRRVRRRPVIQRPLRPGRRRRIRRGPRGRLDRPRRRPSHPRDVPSTRSRTAAEALAHETADGRRQTADGWRTLRAAPPLPFIHKG